MNVLFQIRIEHMLQHAGIAVVIFGNHQDEPVGAGTGGRESRVLDLLAGIVARKAEIANINQLSFDSFALLHLVENKPGDIFAGAAFAHRAENYRNEKWSSAHRLRV